MKLSDLLFIIAALYIIFLLVSCGKNSTQTKNLDYEATLLSDYEKTRRGILFLNWEIPTSTNSTFQLVNNEELEAELSDCLQAPESLTCLEFKKRKALECQFKFNLMQNYDDECRYLFMLHLESLGFIRPTPTDEQTKLATSVEEVPIEERLTFWKTERTITQENKQNTIIGLPNNQHFTFKIIDYQIEDPILKEKIPKALEQLESTLASPRFYQGISEIPFTDISCRSLLLKENITSSKELAAFIAKTHVEVSIRDYEATLDVTVASRSGNLIQLNKNRNRRSISAWTGTLMHEMLHVANFDHCWQNSIRRHPKIKKSIPYRSGDIMSVCSEDSTAFALVPTKEKKELKKTRK